MINNRIKRPSTAMSQNAPAGKRRCTDAKPADIFTRLPNDAVAYEIFRYLQPQAVGALAQVSKAWNARLKSSAIWPDYLKRMGDASRVPGSSNAYYERARALVNMRRPDFAAIGLSDKKIVRLYPDSTHAQHTLIVAQEHGEFLFTQVLIHDAATNVVRPLLAGAYRYHVCENNPSLIVASSREVSGEVSLWDVSQSQPAHCGTLPKREQRIQSCICHPRDGSLLFAISEVDVRVYRIAAVDAYKKKLRAQQPLQELARIARNRCEVIIDPHDASSVLLFSKDPRQQPRRSLLRLHWNDLQAPPEVIFTAPENFAIQHVHVNPQRPNSYILTCRSATERTEVYLWDAENSILQQPLGPLTESISELRFHPYLPNVYVGHSGGTLLVWDCSGEKVRHGQVICARRFVNDILYAADNPYLLCVVCDDIVRYVDIRHHLVQSETLFQGSESYVCSKRSGSHLLMSDSGKFQMLQIDQSIEGSLWASAKTRQRYNFHLSAVDSQNPKSVLGFNTDTQQLDHIDFSRSAESRPLLSREISQQLTQCEFDPLNTGHILYSTRDGSFYNCAIESADRAAPRLLAAHGVSDFRWQIFPAAPEWVFIWPRSVYNISELKFWNRRTNQLHTLAVEVPLNCISVTSEVDAAPFVVNKNSPQKIALIHAGKNSVSIVDMLATDGPSVVNQVDVEMAIEVCGWDAKNADQLIFRKENKAWYAWHVEKDVAPRLISENNLLSNRLAFCFLTPDACDNRLSYASNLVETALISSGTQNERLVPGRYIGSNERRAGEFYTLVGGTQWMRSKMQLIRWREFSAEA